jgi:hypothetical protein
MNSSLGGDPCRSTHRRRSAIRILFAFDPRRTAILLVGGDKAGATRFYERAIEAATESMTHTSGRSSHRDPNHDHEEME